MKMRLLNIFLVSAATVAAVSCAKVSPAAESPVTSAPEETVPAYLPGEVVLKFDESLADLLEEAGLAKAPATRSGHGGFSGNRKSRSDERQNIYRCGNGECGAA